MNLRKILFAIFIIVATSMLALFIFEFLNNFDSLVGFNYQNDFGFNNQMSIRDVKNVTSSVTSDNSTNTTTSNATFPSLNKGIKDPWAIAVITFGGIAVLVLGTGAILTALILYNKISLPADTSSIEMVVLD